MAKVLILPTAPLRPPIRDGMMSGPAGSAGMRLLLAQTEIIEATVGELTPAGLQVARAALVELVKLVKGVVADAVDASEPLLAAGWPVL